MKCKMLIISLFILSCVSIRAQESDVDTKIYSLSDSLLDIRIYYASADSLIMEFENRTDDTCRIICSNRALYTLTFDIIEDHKYKKQIESEVYNKQDYLSWWIKIPPRKSYIFVYKAGDIVEIHEYKRKVVTNIQYVKANVLFKYIIESSPRKRGVFKSTINIEPYSPQKNNKRHTPK